MASICKQTVIDTGPDQAWDAVRDWGALHQRLVPGFATDARVEGDTRVVTFATGAVLTERIITVDEADRRLVWTITDGPYEHHNASAQILETADRKTRFVWRADLLPDSLAARTSELMTRGTQVVKETLEAAATRP